MKSLQLFLACLLTYMLFSFYGIRSPDSEVVFRTTASLADYRTFSVTERMDWADFGVAKGVDGKYYSVFGPGQAVAAVPLYWISKIIAKSGWYHTLPNLIAPNYQVNNGLNRFIKGEDLIPIEDHALRTVTGLFNSIVSALLVLIFFLISKNLTNSESASYLSSLIFALGTLVFPYSGTFFSEPLALLFMLLSLLYLIKQYMTKSHIERELYISLMLSGLFLGLSVFTHLSAILFAPFFGIFAAFIGSKKNHLNLKNIGWQGACFTVGFFVAFSALGYYNYARFDEILETGRNLPPHNKYLHSFVSPWSSIWDLIFSSGKGLLLFCPIIAFSFFIWKPFHDKFELLSYTIIGSSLFRLVFIASRSDWHGGFCLGPRYLLLLVPILILPLCEYLRRIIATKKIEKIKLTLGLVFICIAQQIYFTLGEIFVFLYMVKWEGSARGVNVFEGQKIYLSWDYSPITGLFITPRSPLFLRLLPLEQASLYFVILLIVGAILFGIYKKLAFSLRT